MAARDNYDLLQENTDFLLADKANKELDTARGNSTAELQMLCQSVCMGALPKKRLCVFIYVPEQ